ncbi:hypothetical protein B0H13DRAFT_1979864, partial [Mycena leptocephala]
MWAGAAAVRRRARGHAAPAFPWAAVSASVLCRGFWSAAEARMCGTVGAANAVQVYDYNLIRVNVRFFSQERSIDL